MKKLFILAAAIIALASCQKEQASYVEDGSIKFTTAQTRATVVSDEATLTRKGFKVLGYAQQGSNTADKLFDSEKANSNGTWWEMTTKKYWADNTNYNFFAVYDSVNNETQTAKFAEATFNGNYATTTYSFNNTGENDLIIAGTSVNVGETGRTAPANLTFKHALSRVAFKFVNGYKSGEGTNVFLKIEGLKLLNKAGEAIVTLNNTESAFDFSWGELTSPSHINYMVENEFSGADRISQSTYGTVNGKEQITDTVFAITDYKYILPATDESYSIQCKITAYDAKNNVIRVFDYITAEGTLVKTSKAETLTHEAGKSYIYTMIVTQKLNEIMFDVEVEDWDDAQETEIVFPGAN